MEESNRKTPILTEKEKLIIFSLAQNGLKRKRVAKELFHHPNAITYHVERIRMKTGLNPMDFYDMIKLVELAKLGDDDSGSD